MKIIWGIFFATIHTDTIGAYLLIFIYLLICIFQVWLVFSVFPSIHQILKSSAILFISFLKKNNFFKRPVLSRPVYLNNLIDRQKFVLEKHFDEACKVTVASDYVFMCILRFELFMSVIFKSLKRHRFWDLIVRLSMSSRIADLGSLICNPLMWKLRSTSKMIPQVKWNLIFLRRNLAYDLLNGLLNDAILRILGYKEVSAKS